MEPILAKQSVDIKCKIQASIMMGNYEFYYAAGRFCALTGQNPVASIRNLCTINGSRFIAVQSHLQQLSHLFVIFFQYLILF